MACLPACLPAWLQGPSSSNISCLPFRAWNPGLVCVGAEIEPGINRYQVALQVANLSPQIIPTDLYSGDFTFRFGVQIGP